MTRIKLCGIRRPEEIDIINGVRPDYIGFVFAKGSKRCVTADMAVELKRRLAKGIKVVGVFVDEEVEDVISIMKMGIIDIAQLHGQEDEQYIDILKQQTGKEVIKAFRMKEKVDFEKIASCPADYVLLDSGAGSGEIFDWSILEEIKRPFFLAGGLNTQNVSLVLQQIQPYAVDVSSGIETDGKKDPEKIRRFVQIVREEGER